MTTQVADGSLIAQMHESPEKFVGLVGDALAALPARELGSFAEAMAAAVTAQESRTALRHLLEGLVLWHALEQSGDYRQAMKALHRAETERAGQPPVPEDMDTLMRRAGLTA